MNGANFESVMRNQPGVTGSPELSHFRRMGGSFSLPSLQYPMNTNLPEVQLQKMQNGLNLTMRGEIPQASPQFSGRYERAFQKIDAKPPKKTLDDSILPPRILNGSRMLLGTGLNETLPSADDQDLSKMALVPQSHLNSAWKEEAARAKETLAQKRAMFKERSDQIKASVSLNSNQKGYQQAFPLKLYDLVTEQDNDIISWLPEGNAFKVKHMENFVNIILPAYFKREFPLSNVSHHHSQMEILQVSNDNSISTAFVGRKNLKKEPIIIQTSSSERGILPRAFEDS